MTHEVSNQNRTREYKTWRPRYERWRKTCEGRVASVAVSVASLIATVATLKFVGIAKREEILQEYYRDLFDEQ